MTPTEALALVAAGLLAGTVNTLAGGGSLVALPLLILLGLPPTVANGTNRVGVALQSLVATGRFHQEGVLDVRVTARLLPVTCAGAALGAWASVDLDEALFKRLIGVVMLVMLGVVLVRPKRWLEGSAPLRVHPAVRALIFLLVGAYGGFLQAGVGVFLLAGLVLTEGMDLVRGNAVKSGLVFGFTLVPLVIFAASGLVAWGPALVMAVGSMAGGWLGARLTVGWGPRFVRGVLVVVVAVSSGRLLGLW